MSVKNETLTIQDLIDEGAFDNFSNGTFVIEAVYDEETRVKGISTAHNLEMLFFQCYEDHFTEMGLEELEARVDEFEEIAYYQVFALIKEDDEFLGSSIPVTGVQVDPSGRVHLFV